jgi:hypothetical protein
MSAHRVGAEEPTVSYPKLKSPLPQSAPLLKVCDPADSWRPVTTHHGESARWECLDARWVSLALGFDDELGQVVVRASDGRRVAVETYEAGLALARTWRD